MARTEQVAPEGEWAQWLFLAGRGAGKTRSGAEWVKEKVRQGYKNIALVAPTAGDARDVMVEGPSGILKTAWPYDKDDDDRPMGIPAYEPSKRRLKWANSAMATTFSAEEPDRLRGPQHDAAWCDELAAWKDAIDAWDMLMLGLRIGKRPQVMISTTPRPIPLIRELLRAKTCVTTIASTYDNYANLNPSFFDRIIAKYQGTRLGKQELLGQIVEEAEGALWTRDMIEAARDGKIADHRRIVVGIDPAVTENPTSNLTGIVVAARGVDERGYVLEDLSGRYSPDRWARTAIDAFDRFAADRIVAEGTQGGDLVRHTLSTVRQNLPIRIVHASQSKQARAEPVAALYEQYKITHVKPFEELESQMATWEPLGGEPSPDRLDALVWALTDLFLRGNEPVRFPQAFISGRPRHIPGQ